MNTARLFWLIPGLLGLGSAAAFASSADSLPKPLDPARYEAIWKKSPFTLSSAPSDDALTNAGFAEQLSLLGVTRRENNPFVAILNKTSGEKFLVDANAEGNPLGISLVSISPDADPTTLMITLKKGTETAQLKFDPSAFTAVAVQPNPAPNQPVNPNVPRPGPWVQPTTPQSNVAPVRPMPRTQRRILAPNQPR